MPTSTYDVCMQRVSYVYFTVANYGFCHFRKFHALLCSILYYYTIRGVPKNSHFVYQSELRQMNTDFHNSFTVRFRRKLSIDLL